MAVRRVIAIGLTALALALTPMTTNADVNPYGTPFEIEATAYCDTGITASGKPVREGICAGRQEWLGKVIVVYTLDENDAPRLYGIYECLDTGGDSKIKSGRCVDIWMENEADCIDFGRQRVLIQVVNGKG